jgi:hypothetical protein
VRTRRTHAELDLEAPAAEAPPVFADFDAVAERAPGPASPPPWKVRAHVMVAESLWTHFHKRWREIDREHHSAAAFRLLDVPGMIDAIRIGVEADREALRAEVRAMAPHMGGPYLIPV